MAHVHDGGDGFHRQAVPVGPPDGFVSLGPELIGGFVQLGLAAGEVGRKGL